MSSAVAAAFLAAIVAARFWVEVRAGATTSIGAEIGSTASSGRLIRAIVEVIQTLTVPTQVRLVLLQVTKMPVIMK